VPTLVLVRHGQSLWNAQNRFTGWVDVPLTERGRDEARKAGRLLAGMHFDVAYTSVLARAQDTLTLALGESGMVLPTVRDAALNERDYGDLAGLDKAETAARYGDEQVHVWRRSFDVAPPGGESLKDTAARTLPFFERAILGDIRHGRDVLVVAHGNSNRSIVMRLDGLDEDAVTRLELATGVPLVYELDGDGTVVSKRVLG
jgi:2,3-bisphosphoglycerate-dependent phosphoglycerate mutase